MSIISQYGPCSGRSSAIGQARPPAGSYTGHQWRVLLSLFILTYSHILVSQARVSLQYDRRNSLTAFIPELDQSLIYLYAVLFMFYMLIINKGMYSPVILPLAYNSNNEVKRVLSVVDPLRPSCSPPHQINVDTKWLEKDANQKRLCLLMSFDGDTHFS